MDKKKHLGIIFDVENPFHNKVSHKPLYYTSLITNYPLNFSPARWVMTAGIGEGPKQ